MRFYFTIPLSDSNPTNNAEIELPDIDKAYELTDFVVFAEVSAKDGGLMTAVSAKPSRVSFVYPSEMYQPDYLAALPLDTGRAGQTTSPDVDYHAVAGSLATPGASIGETPYITDKVVVWASHAVLTAGDFVNIRGYVEFDDVKMTSSIQNSIFSNKLA